MNTGRETIGGYSQQGQWQVYGKVRASGIASWMPFGQPSRRAQAEALAEAMKAEGRIGEVHCVPL